MRFFSILSTICGVVHIFMITMRYFSYPTSTRITLDKKNSIETPTLVVCVRYNEVMDYKSLARELPPPPGIKIDDDKYRRHAYRLVTVSQIFRFTPDANKVLEKCWYRHPGDRRVVLRQGQNCSFFRMVKFVMQSFVCYAMKPKNRTAFKVEDLTSSFGYEHTIYSADWESALIFEEAKSVLVILSENEYPYRSRTYGAIKVLDQDDEMESLDVYVRNKITSMKLLQAPYDTRCQPKWSTEAFTECLTENMKRKGLNRLPNTEILKKPDNLMQVKQTDEANQTMREILDRIYDDCDALYRDKCEFMISETDPSFYEARTKHKPRFEFRVMSPSAPNKVIETNAAFSCQDYLLYVCSCFGIWFGLSIKDMNPVLVWPHVQRRIRRSCCNTRRDPKTRPATLSESAADVEWTLVRPVAVATVVPVMQATCKTPPGKQQQHSPIK